MDERRSTLPSIVWVAQPVAVQPQAAADAAVRAALVAQAGVVPQPRAVQFLRSPEADRPVRVLHLLPVLKRPVVQVAGEVLLVVGVVAALLRQVAAALLVAVVVAARVVRPSIRFRARRSSTCCWRPAWI